MLDLSLQLEIQAGGGRKTFVDAARGLEVFAKKQIRLEDLDPIIKTLFRKFLAALAADMRTRHSGQWPGGTSTSTLSRRTGQLVKSIASSIKVSGKFSASGEVVGQIGSPLTYASAQEFGATIRPNRANWLTIPLPAAMDKRGVPILPKARDWPRTFVQKSRKGNLIIFQRRGQRKIVPLYILKKEVRLPPRLNLTRAIEAGAPPLGDRIIEKALRDFQRGKL